MRLASVVNRERIESILHLRVTPGIPQTGEDEWLSILQVNPHRNLPVSFPPPLVKAIGGNDAAAP